MSCSAGKEAFFKLSRIFVKIHRWVLVLVVNMSLNCKFSSLNGRLPANFKLKKGKEFSLHGAKSNCVRKWAKKLLFFWLFGVAIVSIVWFFFSFNYGTLEGKVEIPGFCQESAPILRTYFNVSKNQLHSLASLFSKSDQIVSLECSKEPTPKAMLSDGIACSVKVLCSEELESPTQHKWIVENVKSTNQCPVLREESIPRKLYLALLKNRSVSHALQFIISAAYQIRGKNLFQSVTLADCARERCQLLCYLIRGYWWVIVGVVLSYKISSKLWRKKPELLPEQSNGWQHKLDLDQHSSWQQKLVHERPPARQQKLLLKQQQQGHSPPKGAGKWRKKLLIVFILSGISLSIWLFCHFNRKHIVRREETLANMCDERARMLQDQFNVSMNHVHALAILVSTFHHGKYPSAIDQKTFGEYTERTAFERPLTSGVAYALKVLHSEREQFEKQHGWTIKKMETEDQTLVQDCIPENLDPAPVQDEYAPVIFSQETVSHIVSIDMMSGKEDRENILRARATGKGVLTSPFKLLKSNYLGVVLTFAVYNTDLPPEATPEQRIEATVGYLGASYDVPSLVEKLLHQLASKETIVVNVYDITDASAPVNMYGTDVIDTGLLHISHLDFGDPLRKHEMHCRFKQKPPLPWMAINASFGVFVITLLVGHIFHAAICRIAKVEADYRMMVELKARAEAADVAKSQFLATVSHEIRTPMNGVLGMLQMLMDTDLNATQQDYAQTAHSSGKDLISLINEVLDQAKIESGRLELEDVPFDLRAVLDNVLSLFSGKSNEKGIELAVYVSNRVPEVVIGDPGRFRQIITNLVGNSIKFTNDKGHIFVTVHLADEVKCPVDDIDEVLKQGIDLVGDDSGKNYNTLSGYPVVQRWKSWERFKNLTGTTTDESDRIKLLVTVEDTGVGILQEAQSRIFTPFVQADSSTSRTYGGTGIGLSISKCLVELMGGEIGFVSEQGIGSTFSFTGSLRKGETSSLDTKWQQCDPTVSEFQGLKALVIDERVIRAEVTRYHLERLGISVDIATSMETACSFLCSDSYLSSDSNGSFSSMNLGMVLIDKDVWDKGTGLKFHQLLRRRRQNYADTPINPPKIFLLTTSISASEHNVIKSAGLVDNVLAKPLRSSIVVACLQEALGSGKKRLVGRKKPETLGNLLKGKRILVVDDNIVNRRVAEGALKKYEAIVTCVESGKVALEKLKPPHNFDACFMDLQMPEMDGFEATETIRRNEDEVNKKIASGEVSMEMFGNGAHWHTPILAMTADVIQASNERCMKCGMDDYVSKPFEEEQLYSAVARFFESG
ncbi:histidine kinase 2 isoform X1 [Morus notabilis]|uniref:histidine kinase 2 isoform X1 n=1 Tax=Morus notabilis TaxID=981085 RepID=UPI000CED4C35|nr:histidine kinase 2 isoform X1 [Morus notabilis]